ncbi:unnamed protein product [Periconia digitata]|uniref:Major facilitator superfamily (MFS) profile domain-containing protein n=1 Tax=Periconia digitata TaxID=1303443 RepID=A0A9W4XPD1_9PLEO|nr:unnamed protein product [Periconia digitata]
MGWGVIESRRTAFPRGTTRVGVKETSGDVPELENAKRSGTIVLSPQPSDDPNDPLNWSSTWKWLHLIVVAFGSAVTNAGTTMLTPGLEPLIERFQSNDVDVGTWILTAPTFWTSAIAFLLVSGTDIWGRRPFYFWSVVLMAAANFLSFVSQSFPVLAVTRTANGFFSAPLFTLVTATISDIFFVHQRGKSIAIWNLSLNAGGQVGQVIAGVVTDTLGVQANFLLTGFIWTALIPVFYFTVFESAYFKRDAESLEVISVVQNKLSSEYDNEDLKASILPPRQSYRQQLALSRGRLSNKSFLKGVIKPLGLLSSPIVIYSCIMNALIFILIAGMTTFLSILLSSPPYELGPTEIGLTNLPPFVVGLVASPLFGWMSDASVSFMARKNKGIAEPEFRLVLLLLAAPITMFGLISMGTAFKEEQPLVWILVWMTVTNVGAVAGIQLSINYVIDCLPEHSAQAFASVNMAAAGTATAALGPMITWLELDGPLTVFGCMAAGLAMATAVSVLVYVFGKKMRAWYDSLSFTKSLLD